MRLELCDHPQSQPGRLQEAGLAEVSEDGPLVAVVTLAGLVSGLQRTEELLAAELAGDGVEHLVDVVRADFPPGPSSGDVHHGNVGVQRDQIVLGLDFLSSQQEVVGYF